MMQENTWRYPSLKSEAGKRLDRYHRGIGKFSKEDYNSLCEERNFPKALLELAKDYAENKLPKPEKDIDNHLMLDNNGNIYEKLPVMDSNPVVTETGDIDYLNMVIPSKFDIVDAADLSEDDDTKTWIIRDVWAAGEFSYTAGVPGAGKSVITGDAACAVSMAMDQWHGHDIENPGFVLYFAAERARLVRRRVRAWFRHHGYEQSHARLTVTSASVNLTSESFEDTDSIIAIIKQKEVEMGCVCRLVIFDTLSRVFGPSDQNASKDMNRLVNSMTRIMSVVRDAHINIIHHTTWAGERAKGAIDLDGAVDVSFIINDVNGVKVLANDGSNDGEEGDVVAYTLKGIELSKDDRGQPVYAPVVIAAEIPVRETARPANVNYDKLGKARNKPIDTKTEKYRNGDTVIEIIRDIYIRQNEAKGAEPDMDGCTAPADMVRSEFLDRFGYMATVSRKDKNRISGWFSRATESVEERGAFKVVDGRFVKP